MIRRRSKKRKDTQDCRESIEKWNIGGEVDKDD